MSRTKAVVVIASCLIIAAPAVLAGDPSADAAQRQSAVEHSREVQRMKQRDQEHASERRAQGEKDRQKLKEFKERAEEQAEEEEGLGNDLDDDGADGTE